MNKEDIIIQVDLDDENFDNGIRRINQSIKTMNSSLNQTRRAFKLDTSSLQKATTHFKNLSTAITQNENKLKAMKKQLQSLKDSGADIGSKQFQELQRNIMQTENKIESLKREKEALGKQITQIKINDSGLKKVQQSIQNLKTSLNSLSTKMKSVGNSISNVGRAFAPVSGIIATGFGASIKLASDLNESMNKVEVVFGKSADTVKAFGDTTLTSIGLAKGTAMDMTARYGDMATSMGLSQKEAAKMSTSLVKLAGDTASFKNEKIEVVDNALTGVFTGETESLKRLGVNMLDTSVKAYAMKNGFEGNWATLEQGEKVTWRYKYVMDALKNSQGDFVRTFDSTANQSRVLQESFKQLGSTLGQILLPMITPVIAKLSEFVQWLTTLDPQIQSIIIGIGSVLLVLGPLGMIIGGLISSIGTLASVLSFLLSPIGLIIAGVTALIVGLTQLSAKQIGLQGDTNALVAIWNTYLLPAIQNVGNFIQTSLIPALQQMGVWFQAHIMPIITSFAQMIVTQVVPVLKQMWDMFQTYVLPVLKNFADFIFNNVIPVVSDLVQWFMNKIIPIFSRTAQNIIASLKPAFQSAKEVINIVINVVRDMWKWFSANLLPIIKQIAEFLAGVFASALSTTGDIFGKVLKVAVDFVKNGLNFVRSACDKVGDAFGVMGDAINGVRDVFNNVKNALANGFSWLSDKIADARRALSKINPFDAGGFGGAIDIQYNHAGAIASSLYPANYGGYGVASGDVNVYTSLTLNNNGQPVTENTIRKFDKTILDIIDEGLYKRGRR